MNRPRAIFFDLDETLVDDDKSFQIAVRLTCEKIAALGNIDSMQLHASYLDVASRFWTEYDLPRSWTSYGQLDGQTIRHLLWKRALDEVGIRDDAVSEAALVLYNRHRSETYCAFPDAEPNLRSLASKVPLAVITNGADDTQRDKLTTVGLDEYFAVIVASGGVGFAKPDPAIFRHALDRIGVEPEDAWHIGDSLAHDVAGAKAAGLTAVWLNRDGIVRTDDAPQPDIEITSLRELLPLLRTD